LRFEVEDTGIGISPQQCERLFQPFSQGDGSTTRRFGGTGLGLSISRQLVGLMGGSLEVSSDPGHGSVFSFELDMEERPLRGLEANPGAGLDGFRLLVVDDNATNCTILSHHLQTWGVDHDVVGDAGRALDLLGVAALRGIPYGLVLADYHMPGTDGLELTRRIKLAPGLADTPVVILSSGGFDLKAVTEAGVRLCLTKPVRASRLHDALAEVLAHSAHGRETQAGRTAPEQATKAQFPVLEGRVLLAEDNAVNRKVATEMLRRLGLEVATARDGREALQMVQAERFDLVLMDCQMPELDGLEATRRLRDSQSDGTLRTPIIALTANAMKGDRDRCLAAGMDDYLAKPVRLGALARCLTRWLPGEAPAPPDPEQVERADARAPATGGD
jgi:CheY-like chemotaxis protein